MDTWIKQAAAEQTLSVFRSTPSLSRTSMVCVTIANPGRGGKGVANGRAAGCQGSVDGHAVFTRKV